MLTTEPHGALIGNGRRKTFTLIKKCGMLLTCFKQLSQASCPGSDRTFFLIEKRKQDLCGILNSLMILLFFLKVCYLILKTGLSLFINSSIVLVLIVTYQCRPSSPSPTRENSK